MKKMDYINMFFITVIFLLMFSYITFFFFMDEAICLVKHHTLRRMPTGYTLLSNGKNFKYSDPKHVYGFGEWSTKCGAVAKAWGDYDMEQIISKKQEDRWFPVNQEK